MARKKDVSERMLDAALALAAKQGWCDLSLAAIAGEAGAGLAEAQAAFPTRSCLLAALLARTDCEVLAAGPADEGESVRDRLFDVLMRRFDALQPHREGIAAILRDLPADPSAMLVVAPRLLNSMAWMLEAAGVRASGPFGLARAKGLAIVYLATMRVWLGDDTEDMAPTMAALDRALRRASKVARLCRPLPGRCRRRTPSDGDPGDVSDAGESAPA